jgi:RNA polymerase sigma-70 factor, ECF subfamily
MMRLATQSVPDIGLDDSNLIARVLDGDRDAARALYEAHVRRVHRLIYRLCGDEELTRDYTQDTFVRAFDHLHRFRGEAAFSSWLHRIAVTVTLNGLRKQKRIRQRQTDLDDAAELEHTPTRPIDPDLRASLAAAIADLPEGARMTVILHDIEGFTHREIGEMLGIAAGTSKARLFDARVRLRKALSAFAPE